MGRRSGRLKRKKRLSNPNAVYDSHERWRRKIIKICKACVVLLIAAEIISWPIQIALNGIPKSPWHYLWRYIFIPVGASAVYVYIGERLINYPRISANVKNHISILVFTFISATVAFVHDAYPAIITSLCTSILLTMLYGDKRLTRNILIICLILTSAYIAYTYILSGMSNTRIIVTGVIVVALELSATVITLFLYEYDAEQQKTLRKTMEEKQFYEERLQRDPMTGLYNHSAFYMQLEEMMRTTKMQGALAIVDIDDFKKFNDTWGHALGDEVLKTFAYILRETCGKNCITARYGGEEFGIIFPGMPMRDVVDTMELVRRRMAGHRFEALKGEKVTFSCGIALYVNGMTTEQLFQYADEAMYQAKKSGKNRVHVYSPVTGKITAEVRERYMR
ncbi:MAG: GGDEF domain-containing protein [Clostridia bacterium]|nr:GGDEF domain-containing protein [Clostridia bacterium]